MSLMHPYAVTDRDGTRHATTLADCLNIQRTAAGGGRLSRPAPSTGASCRRAGVAGPRRAGRSAGSAPRRACR